MMAATSDPIIVVITDSSAPFHAQLAARARKNQVEPAGSPIALADDDTDDTDASAIMSTRARVGMLLAAVALLAIGIVAMANLPDSESPPTPTHEVLSPDPLGNDAPPVQPSDDPTYRSVLSSSNFFSEGFLARSRGREYEATLASALTSRVNVINLWATWCTPCRQEMPALGRILKGHKNVQLTTLRVQDSTSWDPSILADLPSNTRYFDEPSTISRALRALGPLGRSLPITLVVDCHQKLYWHHTGELTAENLAQLEEKLNALQNDDTLTSTRCPVVSAPRPKDNRADEVTGDATDDTTGAAEATGTTTDDRPSGETRGEYLRPGSTSTCGDGRCRKGENCNTCPDECGCSKGYHCTATERDEWQCEPDNDVNLLRD